MGVSNLLARMQLNICDLLHFIPLTERGKCGLFLKHSMPLVSIVCVFDINNFFIVWYLSWPLNDKDEHETNSSNYKALLINTVTSILSELLRHDIISNIWSCMDRKKFKHFCKKYLVHVACVHLNENKTNLL